MYEYIPVALIKRLSVIATRANTILYRCEIKMLTSSLTRGMAGEGGGWESL